MAGNKKEMTRMTFLASYNNDSSDKVPLMAIGNSKIPWAFKKMTGQELGFDNHANRKAWMTMRLFHGWLGRLYQYIDRLLWCEILLLLDNCSAHGKKEKFPEMKNICVEFLPPNTKSKIQPLDAGIIR